MLIEVGVPALLMGCSFPLGNAVIQRTERAVGSRAGALYLANTAGAVCGSLVTGFVLLPVFGMQGSATALSLAAALAIAPLYLGSARGQRRHDDVRHGSFGSRADCGRRSRRVASAAAGLRAGALAAPDRRKASGC